MADLPIKQEPKSIPLKCEVCGWIEDFHPLDSNIAQCAEVFCEDCDQPRIFIPT